MTVRQKYAWGGKKKEDELTKGVLFNPFLAIFIDIWLKIIF